jgi:broad specificity phosphatase PhoE
MMAELWFIRHFRTPWNAENRLQGRRDLPLYDPLPTEDRVALKRNLTDLATQDFQAVWCSPLLRARQTAALHGFTGPDLLDDLAELDFGPWEGRLWLDLHAAHPGKWHSAPRELPLGEAFDAFAGRIAALLHRVARKDGPPILAFGHGAWANCAQALCAGQAPDEMSAFRTPNGALLRLHL